MRCFEYCGISAKVVKLQGVSEEKLKVQGFKMKDMRKGL
jgi:hypothetical protein